MFRARVDGQMLEGKPLSWTAEQMLLLGRDGRLHEFNPKLAKEAQKTSPRFFGYSASEMKTSAAAGIRQAVRCLDDAALSGRASARPARPMGQSVRGFVQALRALFPRARLHARGAAVPARGRRVSRPGRISATRGGQRHADAARHAWPLRPHVQPRVSVRRHVGNDSGIDWSENADTIIHEATHQTAYNVGIHKRFTAAPRWMIEGLATMFEAPGVWNAQYDHSQADRINRGRLSDFQRLRGQAPQAGRAARTAFLRSGVSQRRDRRLRRGLGTVVLPVRDAAAVVCRLPEQDGRRGRCSAITRPPSASPTSRTSSARR